MLCFHVGMFLLIDGLAELVYYTFIAVVSFYLSCCLGQETVKRHLGLQAKLPPAHQSTTYGEGFTLSL